VFLGMGTVQLFKALQGKIIEGGNGKIASGQEKYFKNVISFRGLKSPQVEKIFKEHKDEVVDLEVKEALQLATDFLQSKYGEEKQMGIHVLKTKLPSLKKSHFKHFEKIFDEHVYDWGTCDSFSSKVLCEVMKRDHSVAKVLHQWRNADNIWRKRASCVSFVKIARFGNFNQEIIEICSECVKSEERFVQLGVGWVLRELSLADLALVEKFIKTNHSFFSREGLRYAIEKMSIKKGRELLKFDSSKYKNMEKEEEEEEKEVEEEEEEEMEEEAEETVVQKKRKKSKVAPTKTTAKRTKRSKS